MVADMRKVFRQDTRIIQKLHRRVFLDRITNEQVPHSSPPTVPLRPLPALLQTSILALYGFGCCICVTPSHWSECACCCLLAQPAGQHLCLSHTSNYMSNWW